VKATVIYMGYRLLLKC